MLRRLAALAAIVFVVGGLGLHVQAQGGTEILFQDNFSSDQGLWSTGPRDSGDRVIEGGQLRITDLDASGSTSSYLDSDYIFGNLEIEFDTTLLSGNDRGWHMLLLRYQDSDNYHGFAFTAAGRVYGFTTSNGERTVWQGNEDSASVRTGFGLVNHVRVTATGTTLRFTINGELVAETDQPGSMEGRVALSVSAPSGDHANGDTVVAFDNMVIRGEGKTTGQDTTQADNAPERLAVSMDYENALQALLEPGTFRSFEDNNKDGAPDSYSFLMPQEEPVPGVTLHQAVAIDVTNQTGAMVISTNNTTSETQEFSYTVAIPKAFAAHVDDLTIDPPPTAIINPDPVVVVGISSDPEGTTSTVIATNQVRNGGTELNDLVGTFQAFQYERARQFCLDTERDPNRLRCFLGIAEKLPNHITEADCDDIAATLDYINRPDRDDLYLTCRAIQTRDIWECSRIEHAGDRNTCVSKLGEAMERRCLYLTGEAEAICQQETAAVMRGETSEAGQTTSTPVPSSDDATIPQAGIWNYAETRSIDVTGSSLPLMNYPVEITVSDSGAVVVVNHQGVFADEFLRAEPGLYRFEDPPRGDDIYGIDTTLTVESPGRMVLQQRIGPAITEATLTFVE